MAKKKIVDAVYDTDLLQLLDNLELKEPFLSGQIRCFFCGETIIWDNFHLIFPYHNEINMCCTKSNCVNKLISKLS